MTAKPLMNPRVAGVVARCDESLLDALREKAEETGCPITLNALRAALLLTGLHFRIERLVIDTDRERAVITIAESAHVSRYFARDCAWRRQRVDLHGVVWLTWFAIRFGTLIEWEERA